MLEHFGLEQNDSIKASATQRVPRSVGFAGLLGLKSMIPLVLVNMAASFMRRDDLK